MTAVPWIVGGLLLVLAVTALWRPLKWMAKLAGRSSVGLAALYLWSHIGGLLGIALGVNLWNALVLGVLGVPGFGLLLLLNWALVV